METIKADLYKVIAYFSYFEYPLTSFEIFKYQLNPRRVYSFDEVLLCLSNFSSVNGFYGIGDIGSQIKNRNIRYKNAIEKYKKLKKLMKYFVRIPCIKGIAIGNTLSFHFTEERSDIDLFIITENGRAWTTRFLTVMPMKLLRQRPGEAMKNPVDTSFFVTELAMNLRELRLPGSDPYFSFWLRQLSPIFDRGDVWKKFFAVNDFGVLDLPNTFEKQMSQQLFFSQTKTLPIMISEEYAGKVQKKKMPEDIQNLKNLDSRVVVTDSVLKFHKNDRREEIRKFLEDKMYAKNSGGNA